MDIEKETFGLDPAELERFLSEETFRDNTGVLRHITSGAKVAACVPVHILGNPCRIRKIVNICKKFDLPVIEDAAESFGSYEEGVHTGLVGDLGILSFNGNKIVTSGGGGAIVSKNKNLIDKSRFLSQTAKKTHPYNFFHTEVGFNYRMPNINAALLMGQLNKFEEIAKKKSEVFQKYLNHFSRTEIKIIQARKESKPNNWLAAIDLQSEENALSFLEYSNKRNVLCRPFWHVLADLPPYQDAIRGTLDNARDVQSKFICLPLSVPMEKL